MRDMGILFSGFRRRYRLDMRRRRFLLLRIYFVGFRRGLSNVPNPLQKTRSPYLPYLLLQHLPDPPFLFSHIYFWPRCLLLGCLFITPGAFGSYLTCSIARRIQRKYPPKSRVSCKLRHRPNYKHPRVKGKNPGNI
jgi:hypothetical protein